MAHPEFLKICTEEMPAAHTDKSAQYGKDDDPFANFTAVALMARQARLRYVIERVAEKCQRALVMVDNGRTGAEMDLLDIANLGVIAEVLRREDFGQVELAELRSAVDPDGVVRRYPYSSLAEQDSAAQVQTAP